MKKYFDFSHLKGDVFGGLTAGIVALPLALAFGEQSGLGAQYGLYGAAIIAFFAALFGGTATQISGPTAPMTALSMVIIAGLLQVYEGKLELALPIILMVFFLAGLFQMGLGVLKLGTFIKFIPYTVISGFMTGIGVIILITQMPAFLGYYAANDHAVIESLRPRAEELILERILVEEAQDGILVLEEFRETVDRASQITEEEITIEAEALAKSDSKGVFGAISYLPRALDNINWLEFWLTLITIVSIYLFRRITKKIPSTLITLLGVSSVAYFLKLDYTFIQEIPAGYPKFYSNIFSGFNFGILAPYVLSALMLALLGAIDSLLTSVVADNLTKTQHNPNKELIGQGIGNSIAALFGGLPGAGATIRTVVNIQAGGKTRISGMISGVLLFIIIISLAPIASKIPAAVLAGILITVGFGVMDYKGLKAWPKMELYEKAILLTVLLLTVFWQLVYAVAVGLVLASIVFLKQMSDDTAMRILIQQKAHFNEEEKKWADDLNLSVAQRKRVFFKHIYGPVFFGITGQLKQSMSEIKNMEVLVLRLENVPFIDQSGVLALEDAIEELYSRNIVVLISGGSPSITNRLSRMNITHHLVPSRHVFDRFEKCTAFLIDILEKENGVLKEVQEIGK